MISGHDITVRNPAGPEFAFDESIRAAKLVWPEAVVEHGETGELIESNSHGALATLHEIMIYKDSKSRNSWDAKGATPENSNTMIHILADADQLTLVLDDPDDSEVKKIVKSIRVALKHVARK